MITRARKAALFAAASGLVVSLALAGPVMADSALDGALYDINRVGEQMPSLNPDRGAALKRVKRSLDMAMDRLEQSTVKDSPEWQAAKEQADAYAAQLEAMINPPAEAAEPAQQQETAPAATTTTTTQQQGTQQQQQQTQQQETAPAAPAQPEMNSSEVARFNRHRRNVMTAEQEFEALDPKQLHFDELRQKWRDRLGRMEVDQEAFAAYAAMPAVEEVRQHLVALRGAYEGTEAQSLELLGKLGDIPGNMAWIRQRFSDERLPKPLQAPFDDAMLANWAESMQLLARDATQAQKWLQTVMANTPLYDRELRNVMGGSLEYGAYKAFNESLAKSQQDAIQPYLNNRDRLQFVADIAPDDDHLIRNNLLGEGDYDELMEMLRVAEEGVQNREKLDAALGIDPWPELPQAKAQVADQRQKIAALMEQVLTEVRMPEAKSEDQALLDVAARVLGEQDDPVSFRRMVINWGPRSYEETRGSLSDGGGSTVDVTVATYRWDEFQVATAEERDGLWYVYYNRFKYFHEAGRGTLLQEWFLSQRFLSNRILEENIEK